MSSQLIKDIGRVEEKAKALHQRLDRVENDIALQLGDISKDVKSLVAWKNRMAGWAAASIFIGTVLGAVISFYFTHFIKNGG